MLDGLGQDSGGRVATAADGGAAKGGGRSAAGIGSGCRFRERMPGKGRDGVADGRGLLRPLRRILQRTGLGGDGETEILKQHRRHGDAALRADGAA